MTDKYYALTVLLVKDRRDDDCKKIIEAIKMIKGVLNVKGNISSPEIWMAEERARQELGQKLWDTIFDRKENK